MSDLLSDFHEDSRERRRQEDMTPRPNGKMPSLCHRCGWPVDISRIGRGQWQFEPGSTDLHRCKETAAQMRAKREAELRRVAK